MEIIDTTVLNVLLWVVGSAAAIVVLLVVAGLARTLPVTRRERLARHESIPNYYGRLHFAG